MTLIVVGVDGSPESKEALRWAIEEAQLRQATLRAVHAWTYPAMFAGAYVPPEMVDANRLSQDAREALDAAVAEVAGDDPHAYIERVVEHGPPAHVLVEAARDASLLVVGSRGHGGFTGLLLRLGQPAVRSSRALRRRHRARAGRADGRIEPIESLRRRHPFGLSSSPHHDSASCRMRSGEARATIAAANQGGE